MEINGLPPPLPLKLLTSLVDGWRVGQILQATVIRPLNPQVLLLQINRQTFPAEIPPNLPKVTVGQNLELEITQLTPKPVLNVRFPAAPEPITQSALREALPRQTGMAPLLANLQLISAQQTEQVRLLPLPVIAAARDLLNKITNGEQISQPNVLKTAIADSGLLLEKKLAAPQRQETSAEINRDLKALLLRVLNVTTQNKPAVAGQPAVTTATGTARPSLTTSPATPVTVLPPPQHLTPKAEPPAEATMQHLTNMLQLMHELGRQTEGALARIQLHQLNSLPQPDQPTVLWTFELPIRHQEQINVFQFIVEGEAPAEKKRQKKRRWAVTVSFNLKELGPAHARVAMEDEAVSTTFWAERQETTELIHRHLDELDTRFRRAGIEPSSLQCFSGAPPVVNTRRNTATLDIKV